MAEYRPKPDSLIGNVVGKYRITGTLGVGGQGAVYSAEHVAIKRGFAIKVFIPPPIGDDVSPEDRARRQRSAADRFLAEAHALTALEHPNIVEVFDAGILPDGREYMALELLEGNPLHIHWKRNRPFTAEATLRILAQLCCGLAYAHHKEVIHRDLKFSNLFVTKTDLNPHHLKILDFGIAKIRDPEIAQFEHATKTGAIVGTFGYLAPEQLQGLKSIDHRADLFSMGIVAYRFLSGVNPFLPPEVNPAAYAHFVLNEEPADISEYRPDLPKGWAELLRRTLDRDPKNRPPSARAFSAELAALTPGGADIVKEVAPLLADKKWLQDTQRMARPSFVAASPSAATLQPRAAKAPKVSTGVLEGDTEIPISLATSIQTLPSIETRKLPERPTPTPQRPRRWPIAAIAIAAVAVLTLSVLLLTRNHDPTPTTPALSKETTATLVDAAPTSIDATVTTANAADAATAVAPDAAQRINARPPKKATQTTKRTGKLRVLVDPWATVYVGGRRKGDTPITIKLTEGRHRVRIKNDDGSKTFSVDIEAGETTQAKHKL